MSCRGKFKDVTDKTKLYNVKNTISIPTHTVCRIVYKTTSGQNIHECKNSILKFKTLYMHRHGKAAGVD